MAYNAPLSAVIIHMFMMNSCIVGIQMYPITIHYCYLVSLPTFSVYYPAAKRGSDYVG